MLLALFIVTLDQTDQRNVAAKKTQNWLQKKWLLSMFIGVIRYFLSPQLVSNSHAYLIESTGRILLQLRFWFCCTKVWCSQTTYWRWPLRKEREKYHAIAWLADPGIFEPVHCDELTDFISANNMFTTQSINSNWLLHICVFVEYNDISRAYIY